MIRFLLLIALTVSIAKGGWSEKWRSYSSSQEIGDYQFDYVTEGMRTLESGNVLFTMSKTPSAALFTALPLSGLYGHKAVRLNFVHLNPEADATTAGVGVRDSSMWELGVMLITFRGGTADTLTEDIDGKGGYITHAQFTGVLSPPEVRVENMWCRVASTQRTYTQKITPTTTYCVTEGDSVQLWVRQWANSGHSDQAIYYNVGYSSLPSLANVPERSLHITAIDSPLARYDFLPLLSCYNRDAYLRFWSFDIGPRYTMSTTPPWGNNTASDANLDNKELENNFHLFIGERPILETTLAQSLEPSDTTAAGRAYIYVNMPAGFDSATYDTLSEYRPPQRPMNTVAGNGEWGVFIQHANNLANRGHKTWFHTGTLNATSLLDTASGIWRLVLNKDGETTQPDTTFDVGSIVRLIDPVFIHWLGTEDVPLDGYYGTTQTIATYGERSGLISNKAPGIDSIGGNTRNHYNFYRGWDETNPLRFPDGCELYAQKTFRNASVDGYTWRARSMVAWYSYGIPYNYAATYTIVSFRDSIPLVGALDTMLTVNNQLQWSQDRCDAVPTAAYATTNFDRMQTSSQITASDTGHAAHRQYMGFPTTLAAGSEIVSIDSSRLAIKFAASVLTGWTDTICVVRWDSMENKRIPGSNGQTTTNAYNSLDTTLVLAKRSLGGITTSAWNNFTMDSYGVGAMYGDTIPLGITYLVADVQCINPGVAAATTVRILWETVDSGGDEIPYLIIAGKKRVPN